jgi:hypothetical protein
MINLNSVKKNAGLLYPVFCLSGIRLPGISPNNWYLRYF